MFFFTRSHVGCCCHQMRFASRRLNERSYCARYSHRRCVCVCDWGLGHRTFIHRTSHRACTSYNIANTPHTITHTPRHTANRPTSNILQPSYMMTAYKHTLTNKYIYSLPAHPHTKNTYFISWFMLGRRARWPVRFKIATSRHAEQYLSVCATKLWSRVYSGVALVAVAPHQTMWCG